MSTDQDPMRRMARRLATGLDGAFPEVVVALSPGVFSGALRLTGNRHDAEDITQEAFVKAYRALAGYDEDRVAELQLRPWVWTIALNLCRNHARRRSRRPVTVPIDVEHDTAGPAPADTALAVDDEWQRRLSALPDHVRTAVVLRHVADLGYPEIAAVVDRPVGTVKSDVSRGLERLRRIIENEEGPLQP